MFTTTFQQQDDLDLWIRGDSADLSPPGNERNLVGRWHQSLGSRVDLRFWGNPYGTVRGCLGMCFKHFWGGRFCLHVDGIKVGFSQIHDCQHRFTYFRVGRSAEMLWDGADLKAKAKADDAYKVYHDSYSATIVIISSRGTTSIIRSESKTSRSCSAFVAVMSE